MSPRDLLLARRAKKAGARQALRIILEARAAGVPDLATAFAIVDQESQFRNIFGGDEGVLPHPDRPPFYHVDVTPWRVAGLLRWVAAGNKSNGVGFTQLTWPGYIKQAEALGGAHIIKNQLRVGFHALAADLHAHGLRGGLATYNAGSPASVKGLRYADEVLVKRDKWHRVLDPHPVKKA